MAYLNKVFLIGNLTRDPELRYLPNGTAVCDFGLAVNRTYKTASGEQKEEVCFVDVTAWRKQAEVVSEYLQKGRPIFIEGRLKLDQWTAQDGQKRSRLTVVLQNFQFLDSRQSQGAGAGSSRQAGAAPAAPKPQGHPAKPAAPTSPASPETPAAANDVDQGEDSIPF